MYSINQVFTNEIIIQKSRFICLLYPIENNQIDHILSDIKEEYKGATHYCYAFITEQHQKYSDDGEPTGTAGNPILNVLKNKNLENVLAVVVRYFGGIKLGAGGLVRAYTKAVSDCISSANIVQKEKGIILEINVTYDNLRKVYSLVDDSSIVQKTFDENICLIIRLPLSKYELVKGDLEHICLSLIEKEFIFI